MLRKLVILLLIFLPGIFAYNINLPYTEDFSDNSYQDYAAEEAECNLVREPTGGWNGAGALKIFPPDQRDTYCGLGAIDGYSVRQLNVRVLVYFGPEFANHANREDKFIIFNRNDDRAQNRAMTVIDNSYINTWISFATCHNAVCVWYPYEPGGPILDYPSEDDAFKIGPSYGREEEWISVEFEADLDSGTATTYIYTQDGGYGGPHVVKEYRAPGGGDFWADTNGYWRYIDMIGGYWNDWGSPSSGNYLKLSHLQIDDQYIGPPAGFVSGGGTPTYECTDGSDNDGDGDTDLADSGCDSGTDNDESNCGDGECEGGETETSCSADCSSGGGSTTNPDIFFDEDFESGYGSFESNAHGGLEGNQRFSIITDPTDSSNHVVRFQFTAGQSGDDYVVQHFGDSPNSPIWQGTSGESYNDLYIQFKLKYSNGFDWSAGNNKIMIIGSEDGGSYEHPNPGMAHYTTIYADETASGRDYFTTETNKKTSSGN